MFATNSIEGSQVENAFQELDNLWEREVLLFNPETEETENINFNDALNKTIKRIPELIKEMNAEYDNINGKIGIKEDKNVSAKIFNFRVEVIFIEALIETVETICQQYIKVLKNKPGASLCESRLTILRSIQNKDFLPFTKEKLIKLLFNYV